jgi:NAD(P)H-hydrate epimerase
MSGAAILCCQGALRAGGGLVTLACPKAINPILEATLTEAITLPLPDEEGHISESALETVSPALERADVLAIGPGLSRDRAVGQVVLGLLKRVKVPVILDADGLFPLKSHLKLLKGVAGRAVLTPHPGELSFLIDRPANEIDEDRIEVARSFAREHGVVLVLKGRPTAIGTPEGQVYLNPTGNTGLATGGSGDVLTGLITGLIAGGASPTDAAILGAFLHGYTADYLIRDIAERSIIPSDLIDALPFAIAEVERC